MRFFNGYQITGDVLGNPNAPTSWSAGVLGLFPGSKTIRGYRATCARTCLSIRMRTFSPTPRTRSRLRDSGSNGGGVPLTLGASLVIVYRVLSPKLPLNAIVLYDGLSPQTTP